MNFDGIGEGWSSLTILEKEGKVGCKGEAVLKIRTYELDIG